MDQRLCVLLYSKYSTHSQKLFEAIHHSGLDLQTMVGMSMVCVDNSDIRQRLLESENVDVSGVPCILLVYSDGTIEKYQGVSAFQWISEVIKRFSPPQIVYKEPVPEVPDEPDEVQQATHKKSKTTKKSKKSRPKKPPTPPESSSDSEEGVATRIDDIESENDEDTEIVSSIQSGMTGQPKKDATSSKRMDLLAAAQAMQKSREIDDKELRPPR